MTELNKIHYNTNQPIIKVGKYMKTIPQPLVRINQAFVASTALLYLIFRNEALLLITLINCALSLAIHKNPIMLIGTVFLKKPLNEYHQEDRDDQRFNQSLAMSMFLIAYISHLFNWTFSAYLFTSMVLSASTVALMGFCIGCFIRFQYKMYKYRRAQS